MAFPFVPSAVRLGPAKGPRRAVVWHMAEGGNTVGYLSRPNRNSVSVHFVIEYSGRIVQMLRLSEMHSSIRTSAIRMTDDADGFFGRTAAREVMGAWADTRSTLGPNHASIGVEIEGFAAAGPNQAQAAAMASLWRYLLGHYPSIRSLGHRDFASYKGCPGRHIPWGVLGGHGPVTEENDMGVVVYTREARAGRFVIKAGTRVNGYDPDTLEKVRTWEPHDSDSSAAFSAVLHRTDGQSPNPLLEVSSGAFKGLWIPTGQVVETFSAVPTVDEQITAAVRPLEAKINLLLDRIETAQEALAGA